MAELLTQAQLLKRMGEFKKKIEELEGLNEEQKTQLQEMVDKLKAQAVEIETATSVIAEKENKIAELTNQVEEFAKKIELLEKLQQENTELREKVAQLNETIDSMTATGQDDNAELLELRQQVAKLETRIISADEALKLTTAELGDKVAKLEELNKQLAEELAQTKQVLERTQQELERERNEKRGAKISATKSKNRVEQLTGERNAANARATQAEAERDAANRRAETASAKSNNPTGFVTQMANSVYNVFLGATQNTTSVVSPDGQEKTRIAIAESRKITKEDKDFAIKGFDAKLNALKETLKRLLENATDAEIQLFLTTFQELGTSISGRAGDKPVNAEFLLKGEFEPDNLTLIAEHLISVYENKKYAEELAELETQRKRADNAEVRAVQAEGDRDLQRKRADSAETEAKKESLYSVARGIIVKKLEVNAQGAKANKAVRKELAKKKKDELNKFIDEVTKEFKNYYERFKDDKNLIDFVATNPSIKKLIIANLKCSAKDIDNLYLSKNTSSDLFKRIKQYVENNFRAVVKTIVESEKQDGSTKTKVAFGMAVPAILLAGVLGVGLYYAGTTLTNTQGTLDTTQATLTVSQQDEKIASFTGDVNTLIAKGDGVESKAEQAHKLYTTLTGDSAEEYSVSASEENECKKAYQSVEQAKNGAITISDSLAEMLSSYTTAVRASDSDEIARYEGVIEGYKTDMETYDTTAQAGYDKIFEIWQEAYDEMSNPTIEIDNEKIQAYLSDKKMTIKDAFNIDIISNDYDYVISGEYVKETGEVTLIISGVNDEPKSIIGIMKFNIDKGLKLLSMDTLVSQAKNTKINFTNFVLENVSTAPITMASVVGSPIVGFEVTNTKSTVNGVSMASVTCRALLIVVNNGQVEYKVYEQTKVGKTADFQAIVNELKGKISTQMADEFGVELETENNQDVEM